ncbi:hypothetical protein AC1031_015722 [Aphanomyces cochlioides]|nr:hypothetical protein AC1031_015722 [Aphanomyces cochlioides]
MLSEQDARLVSVIKTTEHQSAMAAIQRRTELDDGGDTAFYFTTNKRASRPSDGLPDIDELRRHLTEATVPHEEEVEDEEVVEGESDDEDDAAESSDSDDDFITEDEIQSLDYINVNKASALYANDDKAFLEMLTGFAELAQQRIVPQLKEAMASHNKACLLETADFLARVWLHRNSKRFNDVGCRVCRRAADPSSRHGAHSKVQSLMRTCSPRSIGL